MEITAEKQNKGKRMKIIEDNFRDFWNNIEHTNIRVARVPKEEDKEKGTEKIFEGIIVENFLSIRKEITQSNPRGYRINPSRKCRDRY